MTIGLGTYAFFWQWHPTAETPLSLTDMVDRTADLGVSLFQICDYPLIESYDVGDLDRATRPRHQTGGSPGAGHPRRAARSTFGATSRWPAASTPRWCGA